MHFACRLCEIFKNSGRKAILFFKKLQKLEFKCDKMVKKILFNITHLDVTKFWCKYNFLYLQLKLKVFWIKFLRMSVHLHAS